MHFSWLLGALLVFVFNPSANATFVPENEIRVQGLSIGPANMSEADFRATIAKIQQAYEGIVRTHGASLSITGDWNSETLNAGATQMGRTWKVQITGALARRPELSPDGFTLILCHELGHHLAGFAFARSGNPMMGVWAAVEGQSDYFATQACARKLWAADLARNAEFRATVTEYVRERCDQAWSNENDQNLCYRTSAGVESMTNTMAALMQKPAPRFDTPDTSAVANTLESHPPIQCRMDTSLQGAICPLFFEETIIPGKRSNGGPFGLEAEREAATQACTRMSGQVFGLRPNCWFKARL